MHDTVPTLLHCHLKQISKIPLLTAEEEIKLGRMVQEAATLQKRCSKTPHYPVPANAPQVLKAGAYAKEKMVKANLRLVVSIVKKYKHSYLDFMELVQEGCIGLTRAVEKYDPSKGYRFTTYAYWWVRQAVTRAIATKGRAIRLPMHITEKIQRIEKTKRELTQQLHRSPTTEEIAIAVEIEPAQVRKYLQMCITPVSLDVAVGDGENDCTLKDLINDNQALDISPEEFAENERMRDIVASIFSELSPIEQQILELRFGLHDGRQRTLGSVAVMVGKTKERVRQIETKAKQRLRRKYRGKSVAQILPL